MARESVDAPPTETEVSFRMSRKDKNQSRAPSGAWIGFFGLVESVVDRFGWPGALLIYGVYFVEKNASSEQKRAIIDMYVLGKGINFQYPIIVLGSIGLLAFVAQWGYHRKRAKVMKLEIKRLAAWKTKHQEGKAGGPLHHSEDPED